MSKQEEEFTLQDVKGIGPKSAEKLIAKGVPTPADLAVKSPNEIASIMGWSKTVAKDIILDAKNKALTKAIKIETLREIKVHMDKVVQRIPTGSVALDQLFGGGIKTEAIYCLCGEFASGKTQIAIQAAVNCLKHLKRKVAWIETETGTFVPERILQVAKANGVEIDVDNDFIVVRHRYISTASHQFLALELIERKIKEGIDIGMIIVDSFSAKFRQGEYSGRETLPSRSQEQGRHLGYMDQLAAKYNMAIVLSIQVIDTPDAGGQLHNIMKYGNRKQPIGGNILKHSGTYLVSLSRVKGTEWEACVFDAPELPMLKDRFQITASGIRDVAKRSKRM